MLKNCSDKLRIAIERCSNFTDAEQAVPAKNILAAIRWTGGEANAVNGNAQSAAPVTATPAAPPAPPLLPGANRQATVPAAPVVVKPQSAKKKDVDKRPTTPSVKTAPLAVPTLPPIESDKAKEQSGGIVPRVGDKATPVFISYQSAFTGSVLKIKHALEARGIPCWMATEDLVGNVQDAIGEALMTAPAIIICYSHSYRESMYERNMIVIY